MKKWFRSSVATFRFIANLFKHESSLHLNVPELELLSREKVLDGIDWEIKRSGDAGKKFGVTGWTLLAGFGAVGWAFASIPALVSGDIWRTVWAFLLLESALLLGEALWNLALGRQSQPTGRAASLFALTGPASRADIAATILRQLILLSASVVSSPQLIREFAIAIQVIFVAAIILEVLLLAAVKFELPLVMTEEFTKLKPKSALFAGVARFVLVIGPQFMVPMTLWIPSIALGVFPEPREFRDAALLVAANYLLRMLLVSNAESRRAPFLEGLRRDLLFGLVSPAKAAYQMVQQMFGLPWQVYADARLRVLIAETTRFSVALWEDTEKLWAATSQFEGLALGERQKQAESLKEWLRGFPEWGSGELLRKRAEIRGLLLQAFLPEATKKQHLFLDWKNSCEVIEAMGDHYLNARTSVESSLKNCQQDNRSNKVCSIADNRALTTSPHL